MKKKVVLSVMMVVGLFLLSSVSMAQHVHGGMSGGSSMKMDTKEVLVEGVKVTFQMMNNEEHKKMLKDMKMKVEVEPQATHNIAVTLTDTRSNQPIGDAAVKMKVIDPKGKDQVKMLDFIMGMNQYAGDFTLSEKGKYQILILFKAGGQKRPAGFNYLLK